MLISLPVSLSGLTWVETLRPLSIRESADAMSPYAEQATAFSASTGADLLFAELDTIMSECYRSNWDGYGADAVSARSYRVATEFIANLPTGTPKPELSADPEGCITFEWRTGPRKTLLVSVHPDYRLDFAAIFGSAKSYGVEPFFGEVPLSVLALVSRVVAA